MLGSRPSDGEGWDPNSCTVLRDWAVAQSERSNVPDHFEISPALAEAGLFRVLVERSLVERPLVLVVYSVQAKGGEARSQKRHTILGLDLSKQSFRGGLDLASRAVVREGVPDRLWSTDGVFTSLKGQREVFAAACRAIDVALGGAGVGDLAGVDNAAIRLSACALAIGSIVGVQVNVPVSPNLRYDASGESPAVLGRGTRTLWFTGGGSGGPPIPWDEPLEEGEPSLDEVITDLKSARLALHSKSGAALQSWKGAVARPASLRALWRLEGASGEVKDWLSATDGSGERRPVVPRIERELGRLTSRPQTRQLLVQVIASLRSGSQTDADEATAVEERIVTHFEESASCQSL